MKMYKWNGRETMFTKDDRLIKGAIYVADEIDHSDHSIYLTDVPVGFWHDLDSFTELDLIEDDDGERRLG